MTQGSIGGTTAHTIVTLGISEGSDQRNSVGERHKTQVFETLGYVPYEMGRIGLWVGGVAV